MTSPRRKLVAIDDPLAVLRPTDEPRRPARGEASRTAALYVQLPILQSESLRRAAFELRVHKRVLVAALIDAYVDAASEDGLQSLRALVSRHLDRT